MKNINVRIQFIKKNFLLFFSAFIIPTFILGIILVYRSYENTSSEIHKRMENSLTLAEETLDTLTGESRTMNLYLEDSSQMLNLNRMMNSEAINYSEMVSLKYLSSFVQSLHNAKSYINSIYLYIDNPLGRVYTSDNGLTYIDRMVDKEWVPHLLDNPKGANSIEIRPIRKHSFESPQEVLTIFKKFKNYYGGTVINYNLTHINALFSSMLFYENQSLFIINKQGEILVGITDIEPALVSRLLAGIENEDALQELKVDNSAYFINQTLYKPQDIRVITVLPKSTLYVVAADNAKNTISIIALIIVITVLLAYIISANNYKHLYQVIDIFNYAKNNQNIRNLPAFRDDNKDLYSHILNNIIKIFIENNYLQLQLSERKYRLKVMELQALQYQINPHFLFNTLQTINYEILALTAGKHTHVNKMVENLSDLLRFSLESPDSKVTIKKEIENCQKYIDIQRMRFGPFSVQWEVDASVTEYKIIRLILQPLIENAIKHRIKHLGEDGKIKVFIRKIDSSIRIIVSDNGPGISKETLENIRNAMNSPEMEESGEHIGLPNCYRRLSLAYAGNDSLRIDRNPDGWTEVMFSIPME